MNKAAVIMLSILVLSATSASAHPSESKPCQLVRLVSATLADALGCGSGANEDEPVPLGQGRSDGGPSLAPDRWDSPFDQRGARHDSGGVASGGKDWTSPPDQGGGDSANSAGGPESRGQLGNSRFRSPPSGQK
jgi:hypothetical protein